MNGALYPSDDESANFFFQVKQGTVFNVGISKANQRCLAFHNKYFALLGHAFDSFEQVEVKYKGVVVAKEKKKFRKDIQIMAGYGYPVVNINGDVRWESKSIKFGKMGDDEFEKLYSAVIDVVLQKVLTTYSKDDLDNAVEEILRFS